MLLKPTRWRVKSISQAVLYIDVLHALSAGPDSDNERP